MKPKTQITVGKAMAWITGATFSVFVIFAAYDDFGLTGLLVLTGLVLFLAWVLLMCHLLSADIRQSRKTERMR